MELKQNEHESFLSSGTEMDVRHDYELSTHIETLLAGPGIHNAPVGMATFCRLDGTNGLYCKTVKQYTHNYVH